MKVKEESEKVDLKLSIQKTKIMASGPISSVQFSCSVMTNSLRPRGLQYARPPCPSPTPRIYSNSCPLSQWCHPTISYSFTTSPPAFNLSQHQALFQWVSSLHQVAKVLEFQLQHQVRAGVEETWGACIGLYPGEGPWPWGQSSDLLGPVLASLETSPAHHYHLQWTSIIWEIDIIALDLTGTLRRLSH